MEDQLWFNSVMEEKKSVRFSYNCMALYAMFFLMHGTV